MLVLVGHEIAQGEAIVRCNEVDARIRRASAMPIDVRRSREPTRELADQATITAPVRPHRVAIFVVPLGPAGRKVADLVAAFAEIPGFGDGLDAIQDPDLPQ